MGQKQNSTAENLPPRLRRTLTFRTIFSMMQSGRASSIPAYTSCNHLKFYTFSVFTQNLKKCLEMTPGPIAVNSATFVGIRIGGILGAVAATAGCILPSGVLVSLLALAYGRYHEVPVLHSILSSLRPTVVALIASAGVSILIQVAFQGNSLLLTNFKPLGAALFLTAFFLLRRYRWNPILVMLLCGMVRLGIGLL